MLEILLFIGLLYVLHERTLRRKKQQCNMQGFRVKCLTVFAAEFRSHTRQLLLFYYKLHLCCDAEVSSDNQHNFLQHCIFAQLMALLNFSVQLISPQTVKVHHVANIEVENPVLLILNA